MKKVYAIAVKCIIVCIIVTAVLSVVACTGGGSVKGIALDKSKYVLFLDGEKTAFPVVTTDKKHKDYSLQSSNSTIFKIGENGSIVGLKEGIATLTAISNDAKATATVIVYNSTSSPLIPPEDDGRLLIVFVSDYSAVPSQRVLSGELALDPGTPPNVPDQIVEGWYLDKDFKQKFDFSTPITTALTLYAKWTAGDNPTFTFKTLPNNVYAIDKLKYPLVAFKTLVLPSQNPDGKPITVINSKAFQDYTHVETVVIPKGVKIIKDYAFAGCTNLKTVIFEENSELTTIEAEAFWKCSSLENVVLPEGVTSLGKGAFNACAKLASINLPNGITELTQQVFAGTKITSIDLKNITTLKTKAFFGASALTTVSNPNKLTKVEAEVFVGTKWITNAYAASDGVAYLGSVLISSNKNATSFSKITVREDTTLIANNALINLTNCIIYMTTAIPPVRGDYATNTDGSNANSPSGNKVNIVIPKEYISVYKTNSTWSLCAKQMYYNISVNTDTAIVEFLVRDYAGKPSAIINSYSGFAKSLDISAIMASAAELGSQAYLERIRKDTFTNSNAGILESVILPLRTGTIEQHSFNISSLKEVRFSGYSDSSDIPKNIILESNYSFGSSFLNSGITKIYVPQTYYAEYTKTTSPLVPIWSVESIKTKLVSY